MTQTLNAKFGRNIKATHAAIRNREPFNTYGALSADTYNYSGSGYLRGADYEQWCSDVNDVDYVVMSYATPIAWHTPKGWHIVSQKFSSTTSQHQSLVRYALS